MKRLGLDWETLKKINKKLVYCSITGYGQSGPKKLVAGHDINYLAESGLLSLSTDKNGTPILPNTQIADIAGGSYPAFMNIILIVIAIRKGKGCYLDISMYENMIPLAWLGLAHYYYNNKSPRENSLHLNGGYHRYFIYETSDKKFIALGALEDKFWNRFCEIIRAPNSVILKKGKPSEIIKKIQSIINSKTGSFWKKKFSKEKMFVVLLSRKLKTYQKMNHFRKKTFVKKVLKKISL